MDENHIASVRQATFYRVRRMTSTTWFVKMCHRSFLFNKLSFTFLNTECAWEKNQPAEP